MHQDTKEFFSVSAILAFILIGFVALGMWGCPKYEVYRKEYKGKAELIRATQNRKIRIETAKAKLESAKLEAKAEIEKAKGAAEANKIIADSLGGAQGYLRWLYIDMLKESADKPNREIIYLPTEAGMPILEAGKR